MSQFGTLATTLRGALSILMVEAHCSYSFTDFCFSVCLFVCHLSCCSLDFSISISLSISVCLSVYINLSICLSFFLSFFLSVCLFVCLSFFLSFFLWRWTKVTREIEIFLLWCFFFSKRFSWKNFFWKFFRIFILKRNWYIIKIKRKRFPPQKIK